jgi:hypothetical protein
MVQLHRISSHAKVDSSRIVILVGEENGFDGCRRLTLSVGLSRLDRRLMA